MFNKSWRMNKMLSPHLSRWKLLFIGARHWEVWLLARQQSFREAASWKGISQAHRAAKALVKLSTSIMFGVQMFVFILFVVISYQSLCSTALSNEDETGDELLDEFFKWKVGKWVFWKSTLNLKVMEFLGRFQQIIWNACQWSESISQFRARKSSYQTSEHALRIWWNIVQSQDLESLWHVAEEKANASQRFGSVKWSSNDKICWWFSIQLQPWPSVLGLAITWTWLDWS